MATFTFLFSFPLLHLCPYLIKPLPSFPRRRPSRNPLLRCTAISCSSSSANLAEKKFDWYSHWYPVAPVCDLDKRVPHAKRVLGLDIVIWWDREQREWRVFDDRCPHRLAPLSLGRIDQWGRLQCVHHGRCFDGAGDCKLIPQSPQDGPPINTHRNSCAAVYPSMVLNKIMWFWPSTDAGRREIAMKKKPPYIAELDDPSNSYSILTRDFHYGYEVCIENLMDPAHVYYAHYGLVKVPKNTAVTSRYVLQLMLLKYREGGSPIEIKIDTLDNNGFLSSQGIGYSKFVAPCVYYSVASLGSNSEDRKRRSFVLAFYCVPVSPGRSRVIFASGRNFLVWLDRIVPRWMFHMSQNLVLDSDLYLLHVEELKFAEIGFANWLKTCYVPTKSDAKVIAFRRWFSKYTNNEVDWGTKFIGDLLPSPPKQQIMDRYWSHTIQCSSCRAALRGLKAFKVFLQVFSVLCIGILAAMKQNLISIVTRTSMAAIAVLCFIASKWLSHFIHKSFYFHDYNHAFV